MCAAGLITGKWLGASGCWTRLTETGSSGRVKRFDWPFFDSLGKKGYKILLIDGQYFSWNYLDLSTLTDHRPNPIKSRNPDRERDVSALGLFGVELPWLTLLYSLANPLISWDSKRRDCSKMTNHTSAFLSYEPIFVWCVYRPCLTLLYLTSHVECLYIPSGYEPRLPICFSIQLGKGTFNTSLAINLNGKFKSTTEESFAFWWTVTNSTGKKRPSLYLRTQ